jgi:hypothetical protein
MHELVNLLKFIGKCEIKKSNFDILKWKLGNSQKTLI